MEEDEEEGGGLGGGGLRCRRKDEVQEEGARWQKS